LPGMLMGCSLGVLFLEFVTSMGISIFRVGG
jgi:hypothetical protein